MSDISGLDAFDNVLDRLLSTVEQSRVYQRERDELRNQRDEFRRECDRLRASLNDVSAEAARLRASLTAEGSTPQPMVPRVTPIGIPAPF